MTTKVLGDRYLIEQQLDKKAGRRTLLARDLQTQELKEGGTITVVGTYGYMPPEQFGGRAVPASDLYSLGATLIYLARGLHPADLPQTDLRIQFEPAVNLSQDLTNWLRWLTEPSLNRRLLSASVALKTLESPLQRQEETITHTAQLIIRAGTQDYELCNEKLVTDPELDWLAKELSDWLGLPISRKYFFQIGDRPMSQKIPTNKEF